MGFLGNKINIVLILTALAGISACSNIKNKMAVAPAVADTPTPTATATPTPVPTPTAPSSLSATAGTANVSLSWSAATGASTYTVYRTTTSGVSYVALASCSAQAGLTCSDLTALNGVQYYYVVSATNTGGAGAYSNEATAEPISSFSMTSVAVNNTGGPNALQVSWPAVTGATSYTVQYGTTTAYGTTVSSATSPTTLSSLTAGTTYHVLVVASNAVGSGVSQNATAELTGIPMTRPSIGSIAQTVPSQVSVPFVTGTGSTATTLAYGSVSGAYPTTVSTAATSPSTVSSLTDGSTYYFMVTATNTSGALDASAETPYTLIFDSTPPSGNTSFTMTRPAALKSAYTTADINGILGSDAGTTAQGGVLTLKLYVNDATCAVGNLVNTTTGAPGASYSLTTASLIAGGAGLKTLYYTLADPTGNIRACATTGLSYTYQATPVISFKQLGTSIKEDGTQVGTALSLQRDVCGVSTTVVVTSSSVSAIAATDFTSGTQSITFAAADCTPKPLSFTIASNALTTGDLFFGATITSITGTGIADTVNQVAQVNIVDAQYPGDFMFNQPLYSVAENAGSVALTVQRAGSTAAAASVDVSFVDGTALKASDYTGTTQTVNFAIGQDEATVTVPIVDNAVKGDNKSFIAKLVNPSTGTKVRNLSVAKIRILNDDGDNATCNATDSPYGNSTLGTVGNGTTIPFTLCSLAQLKVVTSNGGSNYRLMSDIINDGTMTPIASFTGTFNGNERVVYNFTYSGAVANRAFFASSNGPSSSAGNLIKNFNLINLSISSTKTNTANGGLIATSSGWPTSLSNNLVSGYVFSSANNSFQPVGLMIGFLGASNNNVVATYTNLLTYGRSYNSVLSRQGLGGGMVGQAYTDGTSLPLTFSYSNLFNTATTTAGGIIGISQFAGTTTYDTVENRGYVVGGTGISSAGIIGSNIPNGTSTETITYAANYGVVSTSGVVGGMIGFLKPRSSESISNSYNYADISTTSVSGNAGGIVGFFGYDSPVARTLSLSSVHNLGAVNATLGSNAGGLIGIVSSDNDTNTKGVTVSIDSSDNSGTITSKSATGGFIGTANWSTTAAAPTNNSLSITNSSNTGSVNATASSGVAGGIIATLDSTSASDCQLNLSNVQSSLGTVTCNGSYCGGIAGSLILGGTKTNTMSNVSSSSPVSGKGLTGGIVGQIYMVTGSSNAGILNMSDTFSNGSVNGGNAAFVGGLAGQIVNKLGRVNISHSGSSSSVTGTASYMGGLFGNYAIGGSQGNYITTTYSTGAVSGPYWVGGLLGSLSYSSNDSISISDSYSTSPVAVSLEGGATIIGAVTGATYATASFTHVLGLGSVTGAGTYKGGFVGETDAAFTPTNVGNFWLQDTGINVGFITSDGNNRTAAQLQTLSTYSGMTPAWVFSNSTGPWNTFVPGTYPTLK
jgi:fibronectin type 3 domain-containing protein